MGNFGPAGHCPAEFRSNTNQTHLNQLIKVFKISDGGVKRSEPVKLSTQLHRKKVYYSKLLKTVNAVTILWSYKWITPSKVLWFITAAGFISDSTTDSLY